VREDADDEGGNPFVPVEILSEALLFDGSVVEYLGKS
jgi:hypothetical protein